MLKCLEVFNISVRTSREMVICKYCSTVSQALILCCSVCHRQSVSLTASCEEGSCRAFFTSFQPDWVPAGKILFTAVQH